MNKQDPRTLDKPGGLLSPPFFRASVAIYTTVALVAFEGTAVAAALPQVAADLGQLNLLPWIITVYLFAAGVATVVAGSVVDALGTARVFRWAVLVFSVAGFAAGLAPSMAALVAIRFVQGVGAGMVVAVGLAATSLVYPDRLSGRAFAANSTVWGVIGAAAPAIAAGLLSFASWRWIFFVNLPLGIISIAAGWRPLPGPKSDQKLQLDPLGVVFVAVFTVATLMAVGSLSWISVAWVILAVAAAVLYRRHARGIANPVVKPQHIFRLPYSMIGVFVGLLIAAAFGVAAYITIYISAGLGVGATLTAWSVFFFTIGWTVGANLSSWLLTRLAETSVMQLGVVVTSLGISTGAASVYLEFALPVLLFGMVMSGVGVGMATNAGLNLIRALTPEDQMGRATSAHHFLRNQGLTLGAAIGGSVLLFVVARQIGDVGLVQEILSGESSADSPEVAEAVVAGYGLSLLVGLGIALSSIAPLRVLRRYLAEDRAEANVRHRRAKPLQSPFE